MAADDSLVLSRHVSLVRLGPDRFLVISTPFDFYSAIPGLAPVSYVADPQRWRFLLQIPGLWRVMFPVTRTGG